MVWCYHKQNTLILRKLLNIFNVLLCAAWQMTTRNVNYKPENILMYFCPLLYCSVPYSNPIYSTILDPTLHVRYSSLLCSTLLKFTLLYSTLLNSTLLYSTLFYSALLCSLSALLCSRSALLLLLLLLLLCSAPALLCSCSALLYCTVLHSTPLHHPPRNPTLDWREKNVLRVVGLDWLGGKSNFSEFQGS